MQEQREYVEAKTSCQILGRWVYNTCYKLISLFEGLLQPSYVDLFSVEEHKSAFFVYFLAKILEDIWHAQISVQTESFRC